MKANSQVLRWCKTRTPLQEQTCPSWISWKQSSLCHWATIYAGDQLFRRGQKHVFPAPSRCPLSWSPSERHLDTRGLPPPWRPVSPRSRAARVHGPPPAGPAGSTAGLCALFSAFSQRRVCCQPRQCPAARLGTYKTVVEGTAWILNVRWFREVRKEGDG